MNLTQILAMLQALYQQFGPSFEPALIAALEQLKLKYNTPVEVMAINAVESLIKASLPTPPAGA